MIAYQLKGNMEISCQNRVNFNDGLLNKINYNICECGFEKFLVNESKRQARYCEQRMHYCLFVLTQLVSYYAVKLYSVALMACSSTVSRPLKNKTS